jgi:hypothetical protein
MLQIGHQQQFRQALRHYCRNPRCRMKLKVPVENPHKAFCTPGCYSSFYLKRCAVCEKAKPAGSTARRLLCRRPACRSAYHQNRAIYSFPGEDTACAPNALRNIDKTGTFSGHLDDRPWRIIAAGSAISANVYHCATLPIDPDTVGRAAANDWGRIRQEVAWSKRAHVHGSDIKASSPVAAHNPYPAEIPSDLSIPEFLRRVQSPS